jgi:hypothetical protein
VEILAVKQASFAILALSVLGGCAGAPRVDPATVSAWQAEAMRTTPTCATERECAVKWAAARDYVLANSGWKLQHVTPDYLETFSPPTGSAVLAWRVVKTPAAGGGWTIESKVWCGTTYSECTPPAWLALRDLHRHVNKAWTGQ